MPLVRIDLIKGKPAAFRKQVGELVYNAMRETIQRFNETNHTNRSIQAAGAIGNILGGGPFIQAESVLSNFTPGVTPRGPRS